MTKCLTRTCLAMGCRTFMLVSLAERCVRGRLVILCYHRVLPAKCTGAYFLPDLVVTPGAFRQQCRALRRHYKVLPLHQAVEALHHGRTGRRPLAAITFDDGYRDNFQYAAPILRENGIKATFFVVADLVGTERLPWYDQVGRAVHLLGRQARAYGVLAACGVVDALDAPGGARVAGMLARRVVADAKTLPPVRRRELTEHLCAEAGGDEGLCSLDLIMDWRQLTSLADQGQEIGSHGAAHEALPQLDDMSLEAEVAGSRRTLESGLNRPVRSFCYPNGDVDGRVAGAVKAAGYHCAVTIEPGSNSLGQDVYCLKRRFIHEDRLAGLRGKASDTLLRMELCGLADRAFGRRRDGADRP